MSVVLPMSTCNVSFDGECEPLNEAAQLLAKAISSKIEALMVDLEGELDAEARTRMIHVQYDVVVERRDDAFDVLAALDLFDVRLVARR